MEYYAILVLEFVVFVWFCFVTNIFIFFLSQIIPDPAGKLKYFDKLN